MPTRDVASHDERVGQIYGASATAYLHSKIHAHGSDLNTLTELVQGRSDARVLDLGAGSGHVCFAVAAHVGEAVAFDLSEDMLAIVRNEAVKRGHNNISTQCGTVERLPFGNEQFDFVFTRFSARHWPCLLTALREVRRVIRPKGLVALIDVVSPVRAPHDSFQQAFEMLRDPTHAHDFTSGEWDSAARRAGFRPTQISFGRLRVEFAAWVDRIGASSQQISSLRALQDSMSAEVRSYFELADDGSFTIDTITLVAEPA